MMDHPTLAVKSAQTGFVLNGKIVLVCTLTCGMVVALPLAAICQQHGEVALGV